MFAQEIRWPAIAWVTFGGLLLAVTALLLTPAFFTADRGLRKLLLIIAGVTVATSLGFIWLFSTLRISVNESALTVGFGPFRETITLERVAACGTTTYRWVNWGGFGVRYRAQRKLYNVPGDRGVAVQVNLDDGRQILFSSPDPIAVCRALRERRPGLTEL
jgi:hypothetical protein